MSMQTIETLSQKLLELAGNQVHIPKEQISLDSNFVADLGFDSLDKMEFLMVVEDEFDISVPDEESDKIMTVRDAVEAIQKLLGKDV